MERAEILTRKPDVFSSGRDLIYRFTANYFWAVMIVFVVALKISFINESLIGEHSTFSLFSLFPLELIAIVMCLRSLIRLYGMEKCRATIELAVSFVTAISGIYAVDFYIDDTMSATNNSSWSVQVDSNSIRLFNLELAFNRKCYDSPQPHPLCINMLGILDRTKSISSRYNNAKILLSNIKGVDTEDRDLSLFSQFSVEIVDATNRYASNQAPKSDHLYLKLFLRYITPTFAGTYLAIKFFAFIIAFKKMTWLWKTNDD